MKTIELDKWEPSEEDPRKLKCAGQRTAQEVFEELKYRLEGMGYLPDEYFLLAQEWENGREIPQDADIFCTTDYGGSEGVYLDVYLKWYENGQPVTRSFITGKTLGDTGADLDRMLLISSAITKAFHGDGGTYARYMRLGERPEPEDMIVHLDPAEQRTIIQALAEQRERQEAAMSQTEQLLRRMTGSITAYMDTAGQRPLRMSDYDKTVLAIRDGELETFKQFYPKVPNQADSLLAEAAGRPGIVGRKMVLTLLADARSISPEAYLTACKRAVDTGDSQRVQTLVEQMKSRLSEPRPTLPGEVIQYAYGHDHQEIAKDLLRRCTPEQIAAAPPSLLPMAAMRQDFQTAMVLVEKGAQPDRHISQVLRPLLSGHLEWMAERLLKAGMPVELDDYAALSACIQNDAVDTAKLLLDRGMDLEQYRLWDAAYGRSDGHAETMDALSEYWSELQSGPQQDGPAMGGMSL